MLSPAKVVVALLWLCLVGQAVARANIVVVYPEAREPLREVFRNLLQGIREETKDDVASFVLTKADSSSQELLDWLKEENPKRVIALGRQSLQSLAGGHWPLVLGAIRLPPSAGAGVSLTLQPQQLFSRLKSLLPQVTQIHVVYSQATSGWLMSIAQKDAKSLGFELKLYPVEDLRSAVARYVELLPELKAGRDALWLPLDELAQDQQVVLPMVLQAAWEQRFAVFSDNLSQVERGVLFALYPDDRALGRRLARLALLPSLNTLELLQDVRWALNTRTATHLGISLNDQIRNSISITFPVP